MSERLELGVRASVVMDNETHGPRTLRDEREGLRSITVPLHSEQMEQPLVDEIPIVSTYSLHVALYALQNPTPENIARALYKIGTSGDCEEHTDPDTLLPLPVSEPSGWVEWMPDASKP